MKYANDIPYVHFHMFTFLFTYSPNNILRCLTFVLNGESNPKRGHFKQYVSIECCGKKRDVVNKDDVIIQEL